MSAAEDTYVDPLKSTSAENLVGGVLIGASIFLTVHSIMRMSLMNITKRWEFPFMNGAMVINEVAMLFYMFASEKVFGSSSSTWLSWLSVVNNFAYFVSKPLALWLAYLRCRSVYPDWRKADYFHYAFILIRTLELFAIFICNIIVNTSCQGNYSLNQTCEGFLYVGKIRDLSAPIWRIYYIISETIFFLAIFRFLFQRKTEETKTKLVRYRRMQAIIFATDLIFLVAMSIYRMIYVFSSGPSYQYAELFSTAFTFFNLTEFGLNLRVLYSKTDTSNAQNSKSQSVNTKIISKPNNDSPSPGATAPKRSYSATSMSSLPTEINHLDPQANVEFVSQSDHYSVYNNQQQQQNSWGFQDHSSFPSAYVAPQALTSFDTYSNNTSPRESIDGYTGLRRPSLRQTTTKLFGGYDNSTSRVQQNSFTTIPIYSA